MKDDKTPVEKQPYTGKTYAYISIALIILGAVALGLIFTVLGIYSLIASVLFSLAALAFANVQKRKNNFQHLVIIRVFGYVLLCLSLAIFIGGIISSAIN